MEKNLNAVQHAFKIRSLDAYWSRETLEALSDSEWTVAPGDLQSQPHASETSPCAHGPACGRPSGRPSDSETPERRSSLRFD